MSFQCNIFKLKSSKKSDYFANYIFEIRLKVAIAYRLTRDTQGAQTTGSSDEAFKTVYALFNANIGNETPDGELKRFVSKT